MSLDHPLESALPGNINEAVQKVLDGSKAGIEKLLNRNPFEMV